MMTLILLKIFKEAIIKLNCIKELFWFNKFEFDLNLNKKYIRFLHCGKSIDLKLKLLIILQKLLYFIIFFILRR